MIVKLLTEHHLEFVNLKGGCRGSSESTHIKTPYCWKSHAMAQAHFSICFLILQFRLRRDCTDRQFLHSLCCPHMQSMEKYKGSDQKLNLLPQLKNLCPYIFNDFTYLSDRLCLY